MIVATECLICGAATMDECDVSKHASGQTMPRTDPWRAAKDVIGGTRVLAGPQLSQQLLEAPDHLAMVLARYRAAAALIGDAETVLELGAGEGIGAGILAKGRQRYCGVDNDAEAIRTARQTYTRSIVSFAELDVTRPRWLLGTQYAAVVSLDVIEHIPTDRVDDFIEAAISTMTPPGVMVVGTPSATFDHLASPQSKAGHINTYTHDRLRGLMRCHFHIVQMFGIQDTALHFGHPDARHYHLAVGIGPR